MIELESYRKALKLLPPHIKEAEIEAEKNDYLAAGLMNKKPGGMKASDKTALFVKVTGDKTGVTYTQNLEEDPLNVMEEAYYNSLYVKAIEPDIMLKGKIDHIKYEAIDHVSMQDLQEKAAQISEAAYQCSQSLSHVEVQVTENIRTVGIVNSKGLDQTYRVRILEASLALTSEGEIHKSLSLETSAASLQELSVDYFIYRIKEWLSLPSNKENLPSNHMKALLDGTVMCNILLTAWQMFSAQLYMEMATPFANKLSQVLVSDKVTLQDDPRALDSGYRKLFDCEGSIAETLNVIDKGKFIHLLHNLSTANQMGVSPTGNAGRDVNLIQDQTQVRVIPTNFRLLEGSKTKQDLFTKLIDGIYIYESFDMFHSLNIASGDFAIPCKGILYEKGKAKGMINAITISGNLVDLFAAIDEIANDTATLSVVMSKSYQVMSPSVLVTKLQVTGG